MDYSNELIRQEAIREDLLSGETIKWTGQPDLSVLFDNADLVLIPFSLFWVGFMIFWEIDALFGEHGSSDRIFMALSGLPFTLIGQYLLWGRFVYKAWKKKRTYYAITNMRVLIVVQWARGKSLHAVYLKDILAANKSVGRNGIGTLVFATSIRETRQWGNFGMGWSRRTQEPAAPAFYDVREANTVYELVNRLRNETEA